MSHKPSDTILELIGWVWRGYIRRQKGVLALALVAMVIEGSTLGVLSWIMQPMFDRVFVQGESSAILPIGLMILGIFLVRAASSVVQKVAMKKVEQRSAGDLRSDLLNHLMRLDTTFFQNSSPGYLIERVQGDVQAVGQVLGALVSGLARDAVAVIWLFGVALTVDWKWTLVTLIGIPILILPSLLAQGYVRRKSIDARETAGLMSTRLDEVFHGINPIKLNALEQYQADRYSSLTARRIKAEVKAALGQASIPGLIDVMTGIGFLCVILYGGNEIIAGHKTVGEFMAFFTAMALSFDPLRRLGQLSGNLQASAAGIERLRSLFDQKPTLVSPANPCPVPLGAPEIAFNDVTLNYGDHTVLRGVSFTAQAGKTTAFVGASGAGKSTIFNALTRLVDLRSGRITINEADIKTLDLYALRSIFSVVSQDAALFDDTLVENITLGREVTQEHLNNILASAHVADFIDKLPQDIETPVGPRGSNLSGGQRQRVAIARALLRDTPILLLDEATSALDTKSEAVVQSALDTLSHGRTTLVIAHRLSTVQNADKIIVMDQGCVADQGTHDELLARGGIYSDLYRMQFKSEDSRD